MRESYDDKNTLGGWQGQGRQEREAEGAEDKNLPQAKPGSEPASLQALLKCLEVHKHHLAQSGWEAPGEIWVWNSENSFPPKEIGSLEECQNPGGKDCFVFSFHFLQVTES